MPPLENIFFDDRPVKVRGCAHPGCGSPGDYRAPKTRELNDYFWFCLDHVREYNKKWDYFAGMGPGAIEESIRRATVWERPTWPMGEWCVREKNLRDKVWREFFEEGPLNEESAAVPPMNSAEREALLLLEMIPPVTFASIKVQYRNLVKHYHPDANGGSREAEEKFKAINHAFTVLKQIYSLNDQD